MPLCVIRLVVDPSPDVSFPATKLLDEIFLYVLTGSGDEHNNRGIIITDGTNENNININDILPD
jgi:hypothetical protein